MYAESVGEQMLFSSLNSHTEASVQSVASVSVGGQ